MMSKLYTESFMELSKEKNLPIFYKGPMLHDIIFSLAEEINHKINVTDNKKHKLMAVFIELSENVKLYSAERLLISGKDLGVGIMAIEEINEAFIVHSGNLIGKEKVIEMQLKLENINSLNRDQLNKLYVDQRNNSIDSGAQGGNIGLIELARRSRQPLIFNFRNVNSEYSFYNIEVKINKETF